MADDVVSCYIALKAQDDLRRSFYLPRLDFFILEGERKFNISYYKNSAKFDDIFYSAITWLFPFRFV